MLSQLQHSRCMPHGLSRRLLLLPISQPQRIARPAVQLAAGRQWKEADVSGFSSASENGADSPRPSAVGDAGPSSTNNRNGQENTSAQGRSGRQGRGGGRGRGDGGRGRGRGGRSARPEGAEETPHDKHRSYNVVLDEQDPMWSPALTDEDLDQDPPGHKSGYVAVIGKPNAGKSTLINAIVGQKLSIVTHKAQTTRHRIVGIASDTNYQMILFDTPGIIEVKLNKLDERMMSAVVSSIHNSEAIIAVVDSDNNPQDALAMFQPGDNWTGPPMAVLLNKADLLPVEQLAKLEDWYKTACKAEAVFTGSALNNQGVQQIKEWAVSKLPEGPTLYPKSMVSEQPERFFVAELIREQIFFLYHKEIPYSCQVQITEFKERHSDSNKDFISATILVERDSQKGILIGKGGAALKKLGQQARATIESFLERQVYLELSVEVSELWRENKKALEQYGYFDAMYT